MGFVGDLLGVGGNKGMQFKADKANILQPTDLNQIGAGYNQAQSGISQQQAFLNALAGQNGIQNQSNVFSQQQDLANQLQGVASGTGPNPALAQLNQTTANNIAAQNALMAGQRGANANVGLMARQAAMQGANTQQQAAGQAATMAAQQQLAGMGALQNQQALMGSMANNQVAQQGGALNAYNQVAQNEQMGLLGALGNYNNANINMQSNVNNANAGIAAKTADSQSSLFGGALEGLGSVAGLGSVGKAIGAVGSAFAHGGEVKGPRSKVGMHLKGMPMMACGGEMLASKGMMVPGQASVSGDSLKNDKVPAMLSPKEIVIPRSIAMSKNAPEKAKQFVAAVLAKNGMQK